MADQRLLGLIDIGTTKVVCLIVALPGDGPGAGPGAAERRPRILGVGHTRSAGLRAGVIIDLAEAETAVRACVGEAERMAGVTIENVMLAVAGGRLTSTTFVASAEVASGVVSEADITRALSGGRAYIEREGRTLVHMNGLGYSLDGAAPSAEPRGLNARRLSASLHAVSADDAPVRNLIHCLERGFLTPVGLVAAPYASSLGVTSAEERRHGVTTIDLGGGTTSLAVFTDGELRHVDVLPVGGDTITYDIARALETPLAHAERIKALYGAAVQAAAAAGETLSFPLDGETGALGSVTKAELAEVVARRLKSIGNLVNERLARAGVTLAGTRVVLTGGASGLIGAASCLADLLGAEVRLGRPLQPPGAPAGLDNPAFAVAMGLKASLASSAGRSVAMTSRAPVRAGYLARVGEWLRDGF